MRKNLKRVVALCMVVCMLASIFSVTAFADTTPPENFHADAGWWHS